MSGEITLHTGSQGDKTTVHVNWFDENNVRKQTDIDIIVRMQDKPREMVITVTGEADVLHIEKIRLVQHDAEVNCAKRREEVLRYIGARLGNRQRTEEEQEMLEQIRAVV